MQRVPRDFDDFSHILRNALMKTGSRELHENFEASFFPSGVFGKVHEAWSNIELEIRGIDSSEEKTAAWNEALEFYMPDVLEQLGLGLDKKVILAMKR